MRTFMAVPLIANGVGIGMIGVYRHQVKPFDDAQIALVESFAAQAVIAIENVRQFRELQTRLEREKATGEVLGVISRSQGEDLPVFDTILENIARLCDTGLSGLGLVNEDRTHLRYAAHWGKAFERLSAGKGAWSLRIRYHAKGRAGRGRYRTTRLTVRVAEMTEEEREALRLDETSARIGASGVLRVTP